MTAVVMVPMGEPLVVHDVLVGGALTDGPEVLAVFTGVGDGDDLTVSLQWDSAQDAERHLAAMLADVRSRLPLPPVVDLSAVRR